MPVVISLLRGVNLGGNKRVKMDALSQLYASLGLHNVRTYVQSGNVVFRFKGRDLPRLARRIEREIEKRCGFHSDVVLRTASDLRDVITRNPFGSRRGLEPSRLVVTFLAERPAESVCQAIQGIQCSPEEFQLSGREIFAYFPNGFGNSNLPALMERALKKTGTARNWRTVTKLLELTEEMELPR